MQAPSIKPPFRPIPKPQTVGAQRVARSMLWMLRRRARRHDARKFTA